MNDQKKVLIKAIRLEKFFRAYERNGIQKKRAIEKFENVWGKSTASHYLHKHGDAESLIWAFDNQNLELFINKF